MNMLLRSLVISISIVIVCSSYAFANPAAGPTGVAAVPRYATPPSILVRWNDVPDETGYEVWRSVDGWAMTNVATVGQNVTSWRDTGVNNISQYQINGVKSIFDFFLP